MLQLPRFIGSHIWIVPDGVAYTSPAPGTISQAGTWPDASEPNWANWAMGDVESCEIDPKLGPREEILSPSPGAVQATDVIVPYAVPQFKFTLLQIGPLAVQLALNTQALYAAVTTQFNPNGGGGPGVRGIIKAQKYDHNNNLILNWQSWAFIELSGSLKMAPKNMTKPEFIATLLYSVNNTGSI